MGLATFRRARERKKEVEAQKASALPDYACKCCGFPAKSPLGLSAHMRVHRQEKTP